MKNRIKTDAWRKKRVIALVCAAALCLSGCGQLEIEERAFPMALCVTPSETTDAYEFFFYFEEMESAGSSLYHKENAMVRASGYPQAYTMFGRAQAAQLDDSHMKVILCTETLLEDDAFWASFLQYAMKEHHFSWNTMVYLLEEGSDAPQQLAEGTNGRPGSYLRSMAESDEQEKTAGVPTLGDLYMEYWNQERALLLPVLAGAAPPSVSSYRIFAEGAVREHLSADEARLLQLLQGNLKKLLLELSDGTVLELESIRTKREYVPSQANWQVTLCMDAAVQNRVALTESMRSALQKEAVQLLQRQLAPVARWAKLRNAEGVLVQPEFVLDLKVTE